MTSFLTWLDCSSVQKDNCRFVFAMMNDFDVLKSVNANSSQALFRPGRFDKRVHVGGCDGKQFAEFCHYVFELKPSHVDINKNKHVAELFNKAVALCDAHCLQQSSPLTVLHAQKLVIETNFSFETFLQRAIAVFGDGKE